MWGLAVSSVEGCAVKVKVSDIVGCGGHGRGVAARGPTSGTEGSDRLDRSGGPYCREVAATGSTKGQEGFDGRCGGGDRLRRSATRHGRMALTTLATAVGSCRGRRLVDWNTMER